MRGFAIALGTLAVAGCGSGDIAVVEDLIRENLSRRGEVIEVAMSQQGNGRMGGSARVRSHQGRDIRLRCTARRRQDGRRELEWNCAQRMDAVLIEELETAVRNSFAPRGNVVEVRMVPRDEDHAAGFARVRAAEGREDRFDCTADRNAAGGLDWRCLEPGLSGDVGTG